MDQLKVSIGFIVGPLLLSFGCALPLFQPGPKTQVIVETVVIQPAGELSLVGIYEAEEQTSGARQFWERVNGFQQETGIKVDYDVVARDIISEYVLTNLAAGVPLDLAPVRPESVPKLVEADLLLSFDSLGQGQLSSQYLGDSACLVQGKRYCAVDRDGLAWVIPRNVANSTGAVKLLVLLVK